MTAFRTYRHDFTLFTNLSATDPSRIPAENWTIDIYRRGSTASQAKTITTGGGQTLTVYDIGDIQVNDTVLLVGSAATRTISAISSGLLTFAAGGSGTFTVGVGSRLTPTNNRPKAFTSTKQFSPDSGNSVTTNSLGAASFYTTAQVIDCIASDTLGNLIGIPDQTGLGVATESPYQWNAVGDGVTDDAAAIRAVIARAVADGVQSVAVPPGTYLIGSTITMSAVAGLAFRATAPGAVTFLFSGTGVMFDLTGACSDVSFEDLILNTTQSNTTLIQTSTSTSRLAVKRCSLVVGSLRTGIVEQGTDARIVDCVFVGATPVTLIRLNGAQRAQIQGCFGSWSGNATGRIIDIDTGCRSIRLMNCDFKGNTTANSAASGVVGLRNSAAGTAPRDIILTACHFQAGTAGRGVDIDAAQGFQAIGCTMEDCLVGYSIDAGTSIKIIGGLCVGIQQNSVDINAGSHIRIVELESSDVSQAGAGTQDHVNIAAGIDDVSIFGLTAGNFIRASGIQARHAVRVEAGASDRVQIIGVRTISADFTAVAYNNQSTSREIDIGHNIEAGTAATYVHTAAPAGSSTQAGQVVGVLTLSDGTTAPNVQNVHSIFHAPSGNITYTALSNGSDGQRVTIVNTHPTNTITVNDGATFAMAGNMILSQFDSLTFILQGSTWVEVCRSNN